MLYLLGISNRTSDYTVFYISSVKLRVNHPVIKVFSSQFTKCLDVTKGVSNAVEAIGQGVLMQLL